MNEHVDMMKLEMQDVLENNILRFWLDKMIDNENGSSRVTTRSSPSCWATRLWR